MNSKLNGSLGKIPDRDKVESLYNLCKPQYEIVLRKLTQKIRKLLNKNNINSTIKHRIKTFNSFFNKILKIQNTKKSCIKINDIIGIRLICPFIEDLDKIEKIISDNFKITEIQRKGSKNTYTEFGYNSTHILIEIKQNEMGDIMPFSGRYCEIQLRTILQEAWAEIEHELIYKANFSLLNNSLKKKLASLNATLTLSDIIFQEIRDYQKEIHQLDEKRRESIHDKIQINEQFSVIDNINSHSSINACNNKKIHINQNKNIDKLLFDALDSHSNHDYSTAIKIYTLILNKKPGNEIKSIIYNHRGMAYFVLSKYNNSIKDFTAALKFNPSNYRARNNRGMTYKLLHQYSKALEDFNQSLEINTYQMEGYYSRALIYMDLDNYLLALEDCLKVLNIKPDFLPAQRLKSIIQTKIFEK